MCFESGAFANCLKIAEVVPVFKKGDRSKATNYRPISLLSQFDKIKKYIYLSPSITFFREISVAKQNSIRISTKFVNNTSN